VPEPTVHAGHIVLHVEDEAPNRALLRALVARAPEGIVRAAQLIDAADLASAREQLSAHRIDLVLLDVRLPDGNGLDLARELRDAPGDRRPRVVVMSASVLPSEREAAIAAGADRFVPKPYNPSELTSIIASELEIGSTTDN
jgi:two-component system KDP operon response regulator KdpE